MRNVAYLVGIVLTIAVASHVAFDVSRAGTPAFYFVMAVPTIQTIFALESEPPPSPDGNPPLVIEVIGKQWWWEFRYPEHLLSDGQTPLTTASRQLMSAITEAARAALGDVRYNQAWAAGQAFTLEQAAALALEQAGAGA